MIRKRVYTLERTYRDEGIFIFPFGIYKYTVEFFVRGY